MSDFARQQADFQRGILAGTYLNQNNILYAFGLTRQDRRAEKV